MLFFILWLIASLLVAKYASTLNRVGIVWFLISVLISPLLAGLILLLMGKSETKATNVLGGVSVEFDTFSKIYINKYAELESQSKHMPEALKDLLQRIVLKDKGVTLSEIKEGLATLKYIE